LIGPWAKLQQSEDVSTTVKTLKKTLVGVQWYSVHVSQTAETIQFPLPSGNLT